ncbi:hypothetical protein HPHPP25_0484 [Helicobacter pylori Hp P-25]|nr:hypothetical protein HPHPP25_0484 [Helicobacter pylori Hp P-25]EJC35000.1 hypothetical protein HPHPP25C_0328 [Helicobacter pylori Hp P-25c]EJC38784.1 hypothetical protein HPHPP25D_0464 [Helicobacter pylori Hp P-25d]
MLECDQIIVIRKNSVRIINKASIISYNKPILNTNDYFNKDNQ